MSWRSSGRRPTRSTDEGSPEAELFVRHRTEPILCGMVSQVVKGLRQIVTKQRLTGANAKTIGDVANYLGGSRPKLRQRRSGS
jgi:hypothetical protein